MLTHGHVVILKLLLLSSAESNVTFWIVFVTRLGLSLLRHNNGDVFVLQWWPE